MTSSAFTRRLEALGIRMPTPPKPSANYVPYRRSGNLIYIAGQVSDTCTERFVGKLGEDLDVEAGRQAARLCAINILAQLHAALDGQMDKVVGCVRLGGFVNASPTFAEHPKVINGASDLMVEVFGDAGRHARAAVGCASLPRQVAVEVDAIFEVA